ncbi:MULTISPECIES: XRE family transcriptional regulator [Bacillaceae]|uniref:DNA-binding protein n=1 Tax=Domibacillus aminovorans TaxID=29332 RepID=A0A177KMW7_9BACI|nr:MULTISPECIES: XRE family transcriptional regulator [Bacillaceae]OAH54768.1 DNA-binding protein [Domibacillus aminovorans]
MEIGSKIRDIRKRKKITIAQMSEQIGLSKGFISNIENDNTSPSLNTLQAIATFLDVPLPYLLLEKKQHMKVVRKEERVYTTFNDIKIEHLTSRSGLRMMYVKVPSGASTGEAIAHEGEESHLVLKGIVLAEQGEDSIIAKEGDSFSWNASVPHFVKNIGEEEAVLLIAVHSEDSRL